MKQVLLCLLATVPALFHAQNWTTITCPLSNDLNDVFFVDDSNGWIVGRQGKIIRTTDGGQSWTEQNSGTTKDLTKVFMVSNSVGYAVGDGGTFIKYNGSTWSAKSINFSQDMCGVYFLDASEGWISGDWGRIMYTANGGDSWTNQVTNATYSNKFNDLFMLSGSEGWAVGTSGRVLKYDGSNWQNVSNPASSGLTDLYAASFSSSSNGFMTGKKSSVYFNDGSALNTHNTALPDNSYHVYDVKTVSSQLAYAATAPGLGGQGMILKYNGSVWQKEYEYTGMGTELFYGITATPSGNVFAVGSGGLIKAKISSVPTSVMDAGPGNVLSVFPNPSCGNVTVRYRAAEGNVSVSVKDISGRVLHSTFVTAINGVNEFIIPSDRLAPGFYTCTISDGVDKSVAKFTLL